jgi:bifunctional non-homologous end joining protein LigD
MARIPTYAPQLAQLVKSAPSGSDWLHELKYDGYRIGCRIDRGRVTLLSRKGNDWTTQFAAVSRDAIKVKAKTALLDGEVCRVLPDGRTSFQALQNGTEGTLVYFAFDLLHLDGTDLIDRPLEERKAALQRILRGTRIQFGDHLDADGPAAHREACRLGLEGIVSKLRGQPYRPGKRVDWVKTKCVKRQEFVVGGFTDPEGARDGIGALLVGYYSRESLIFAGKVGTGFTVRGARELRATLNRIEIRKSPFDPPPAGWLGRNAHWVKPALVAEVVFTEWTDDGKIRHPSFQGLREDRDPMSVVRERESVVPNAPRWGKVKSSPPAESPDTVRGIRITHPDRVMYDDPRLTKLDVARYYDAIAPAMMRHVEGRPLTLVRCGDGISGECIYMKHSKLWAPRELTRVKIQEKTKVGDYLVIESPEALVALAQMDILEIHTWNTRHRKVEHPDRIVLDLDPGPQVGWPAVVAAARQVRALLRAVGLESFVKTTGGKGLHVVAPLEPRQTWDVCLAFARAAAGALVRYDPSLFTTAFSKKGRERQILIDYLRNNRTNTSIAAFSTRARPGAAISMPLAWAELTPKLTPASFTVTTAPRRMARRADPWAQYFAVKQRLSPTAVRAIESVDVTGPR